MHTSALNGNSRSQANWLQTSLNDSALAEDLRSAEIYSPKATKSKKKERKRKKSESEAKSEGVPMQDRIKSKATDMATAPPKADSLPQLLIQGLRNQDTKALHSVLGRGDAEICDSTIRKLPVEGVVPLLAELQKFIQDRGMVRCSLGMWLRSILQHHSAYLMGNPHCHSVLSDVRKMLEARTTHYYPLMQVKGKLDLLAKQMQAKADDIQDTTLNKEALLVYQDDSDSDVSDVANELLLPSSDAEDTWPVDEDESEENEDDAHDMEVVNGNGVSDSDAESIAA